MNPVYRVTFLQATDRSADPSTNACTADSAASSCGCTATATIAAVEPNAAQDTQQLVSHQTLGPNSKGGAGGQLTVFHSAAAEYLQNREYQGLIRAIDANPEMEIRPGQYGVAADYAVHDKEARK